MDKAHTGRFIRKRKGSWSNAAEPGNRWLPAEMKTGFLWTL
jgi:hypothetical protein